jgi:hypothetical protein
MTDPMPLTWWSKGDTELARSCRHALELIGRLTAENADLRLRACDCRFAYPSPPPDPKPGEYEPGDELDVMYICFQALQGLQGEEIARVLKYLTDRHTLNR